MTAFFITANMKYISLVCLILQNATLILTMRYARTRSGDQFFATVAVVSSECLKVLCCLIITLVEYKGKYPITNYFITYSTCFPVTNVNNWWDDTLQLCTHLYIGYMTAFCSSLAQNSVFRGAKNQGVKIWNSASVTVSPYVVCVCVCVCVCW